ncbi:RING finger protein 222 [Ornithorhynchus anatinus]|uniref:Ring finger protein 222 n=1 Tax=Ornithorhynchus anatinus TaxID=9258 RepID=A0A6I8PMG2_ORNAN|nr:RING finger protein 222 [Ornithorhynchus anatinus]
MSEGESKEGGGGECPVCYERFRDLEGAGRTLSCGHVFCHDCLVRYLLSRRAEGRVPQSLVCPVCRHVTFLSRRGPRRPPDPARGLQTLVVPPAPPDPDPPDPGSRPVDASCPGPAPRPPPAGLVREPQVFAIGTSGMPPCPLSPRDPAPAAGTAEGPGPFRARCRSPALLLVVLVALVAGLAAILPWILLARRRA